LRHAADLVRLAGGATEVLLTIDGQMREFLAVAEQLDFPIVVCAWPDGGSGGGGGNDSTGAGGGGVDPVPPEIGDCTESGTQSMRTLIAWEPERMAEVVRIVADTGATPAQEDVPDVMTGLPTFDGSDSAVVGYPVSYPGFSGEYIVRDVGSWYVRQGTQSNSIEGEEGTCSDSRVTFDWAELGCELASFRFAFDMDLEPAYWEYRATGTRNPSAATGDHRIVMSPTAVDGVRLRVLAWTPPEPEPMPPLPPVDTVTTLLLDVSFDVSRVAQDVVLRFRVANPTEQAITFEFPSGQRYDFSAIDPSGEVLWTWSADKAFTAAFEYRTLAPGEAMEFEERWTPGAATGPVGLTAELTSSNLPVAARAEVEL
jgi:Intracellular proteinase inhibitor